MAAEAYDGRQFTFGKTASRDRRRPFGRLCHRETAITARPHLGERRVRRGEHVVARHIGPHARVAQATDVDERHRDVEFL
jgi:hypothetical protein